MDQRRWLDARGGGPKVPRARAPRPCRAPGRRDDAGGMTKSSLPAGCIVVGVDGSEHAERAITWAAAQAALEGRTLALVHSADQLVLREHSLAGHAGHRPPRADPRAELCGAGRPRDAARERATLAAPASRCSPSWSTPIPARPWSTCPRTRTCSWWAREAGARCAPRCSARSAPPSPGTRTARWWSAGHPSMSRPRTNRVVVGADGTAASRPVLEFAFAQASLRGIPLTVMHCFWDVTAATGGPARRSRPARTATSPTCGC